MHMSVWMQQKKLVYRANQLAKACMTTVVMAAARFTFVEQTTDDRRLRIAVSTRARARTNSAPARTAPLLTAIGRHVCACCLRYPQSEVLYPSADTRHDAHVRCPSNGAESCAKCKAGFDMQSSNGHSVCVQHNSGGQGLSGIDV